jgi:hypothetical protein
MAPTAGAGLWGLKSSPTQARAAAQRAGMHIGTMQQLKKGAGDGPSRGNRLLWHKTGVKGSEGGYLRGSGGGRVQGRGARASAYVKPG